MRKAFITLMMVAVLILTACASPTAVDITQPSAADQAATIVAGTMRALPTSTSIPTTTAAPAELLPHTLYYLSNDGLYRRDNGTVMTQVYRMERDGKTISRLTNEPNGVDGYDVSLADGTVVFIAENQLVLINADGSNRRVLVDGGAARIENNPNFYQDPISDPAFSPEGQTIAYARKGLNLYDMSTSVSTLVIADQRSEMGLPIETYAPTRYSSDGTKLLVALGHWEVPPVYAVYYPETSALVRASREDGFFCCGGPVWSGDGSSFYGVIPPFQFIYQSGEIWRVDAANGAVTTLFPFVPDSETMSVPAEPYFAFDDRLYYFFGSYRVDSGYYEAPVLQLVRSAPDGATDRTILRNENFVLMREALWAPDASFVIVATAPSLYWSEGDLGVLELYYTDGQKAPVWLAPLGRGMRWGP